MRNLADVLLRACRALEFSHSQDPKRTSLLDRHPSASNHKLTPKSLRFEAIFMTEARVERRLAAILAADVAGYSRLMGLDEEGTLATLKACRREILDPQVAEHRGRVVKTTGDGALIEFPSAVDAVRCAVDIQRAMVTRNVAIPDGRRIQFRIGINVGDIIVDEGDIYGDGVNIAARVEAIAQPGGICVSDYAYHQIKGKVALDFVDMGEQQLKNISTTVRVYGVRLDASGQVAKVTGVT